METLFGLPAHPLVVHAAVVLVPLSAIGALACIHPGVRRRFGVLVAVLACIGAVAVWMATESGEALEEQVDETELVEEHTEMGERPLPWVIALALATTAMVAFSIYERRQTDGSDGAAGQGNASRNRIASIGLAAAVALTAVGATVVIIDVGHSGAKATWDEVGEDGDQDSEDEEGEEEEDDDEAYGLAPDGPGSRR